MSKVIEFKSKTIRDAEIIDLFEIQGVICIICDTKNKMILADSELITGKKKALPPECRSLFGQFAYMLLCRNHRYTNDEGEVMFFMSYSALSMVYFDKNGVIDDDFYKNIFEYLNHQSNSKQEKPVILEAFKTATDGFVDAYNHIGQFINDISSSEEFLVKKWATIPYKNGSVER